MQQHIITWTEAGIRTYLQCGPSTAIRTGNGDAVAKTDRPVRMEAGNNDSSRDASSVGVAAEVAVVPARHAQRRALHLVSRRWR
jgi:hypothetical protein